MSARQLDLRIWDPNFDDIPNMILRESGVPQPIRSRPLVDVPRAANADPDTSHLAAERIKASGALGDQQRRVLEMVRKFPGCTSAELANAAATAVGGDYAKLRTQYARRLPELAIHHIRRGEARVCKVTKAKCVTWWPR